MNLSCKQVVTVHNVECSILHNELQCCTLNTDVLIHIAELDIPTYRCMLNLPDVARYFHGSVRQSYIQQRFTVFKHGRYTLNDEPHRLDGPAVVSDKCQYWYQHGKLHRDNDLPAIIGTGGRQYWFQHGESHRDNDLPAAIYDGKLEWYQHGKLHRDNDLPAEVSDKCQYWYQHGKLHRDNDLPAAVFSDDEQQWYQHGERHRDGNKPAIIRRSVIKEWWIRGQLDMNNNEPITIERYRQTEDLKKNGWKIRNWQQK
jgi:hypothetical protein